MNARDHFDAIGQQRYEYHQRAYRCKPGQLLHAELRRWGFRACSACNKFATKMDRWGVEGCRAHKAEIISHLQEQARRRLFVTPPAWTVEMLLDKVLANASAEDRAAKTRENRNP